ncbi:hypothetical protein SteCoe_15030 [Stentor coeruleus]|uniref:non-specific serine/threonine protein kinase n=1 Tax=Stentor coeruleus TaxID=5963 RepID=A0A1R2C4S6_9CILI|nr:hypothetical protein SteCoe_15030 [Stentor coeruleus]
MGCWKSKEQSLIVVQPSIKSRKKSKHGEVHLEYNEELYIVNDNISDLYNIIKPLSKGKYGLVQLATSKLTGKQVAVKIQMQENENVIIDELSTIKKLDHPNIIKYIELFRDKKYIYIVMEYCSGGELLGNSSTTYPELFVCEIMFKLLHAVSHMHSLNVCHRDIKIENCLLDSYGDVKLIDFGFSCNYIPGRKFKGIVGTPFYMAPEVFTDEYGPECDIWSLGVLMHILLLGFPPFDSKNKTEVIQRIKTCKVPFSSKYFLSLSIDSQNLLKSMLQKDPNKRISCEEALKTEFFNQIKRNHEIPNDIETQLVNSQKVYDFQYIILTICLMILPDDILNTNKEYFRIMDSSHTGFIYLKSSSNVLEYPERISYTDFLIYMMKNEIIQYCFPVIFKACEKEGNFSKEKLRQFLMRRGAYIPENFLRTEIRCYDNFLLLFN